MTKHPPPSLRPWMHKVWPYALLLGLNAVFFWDSLFAGKVLCMRDSFCDLFPFRQFAAEAFRAGAIPLWNSASGLGKPFLADPIAGALYPPHFLFVVLPATWAFKLSYILHFFLAGAGTFALMRQWRFSTAAALLSAVVFMFNTWLMAWAEFFCSFNAIVWWPLTMLAGQQMLERELAANAPASLFSRLRRNFPTTVLFAILVAFQYLAGSPELVLYSLLVVGMFVTLRCLFVRQFRALVVCVLSFLVAGTIVFCLVLPQFWLSLEFISHSERSVAVDPGLDSASFHPANLLTFVFPFIYGRPGYPEEYWAQTIYEFCLGTCYLGIVPMMFGFFSLYLWNKRDTKDSVQGFVAVFFAGLATLGLLMAAGKYTPLYELVYSWVPLFRHFRWPTKFLVWAAMGGSVLAGVGLDALFRLLESQKARVRWINWALLAWGVPWVLLLGVCLLKGDRFIGVIKWLTAGTYIHTKEHLHGVTHDLTIGLFFIGISLLSLLLVRFVRRAAAWHKGLFIAITFANLFVVSRQVQFLAPDDIYEYKPENVTVVQAQGGAVHSMATTAQEYLYGSTNLHVWRWAKDAAFGATWLPYRIPNNWQGGLKLEPQFSIHNTLTEIPAKNASRLADIMGIGFIIATPTPSDVISGQVPPRAVLNKRPTAVPRAYIVGSWKVVENIPDAFRDLIEPGFNPKEMAILERGSIPVPQATFSQTSERKVLALVEGWNRVHLDVDAGPGGLLVLNHAWYPGWKASVDGQEQPIHRTNIIFRGVVLPAGRHQVEFTYQPWQFRVGSTVSLLMLIGVVLPTFALNALRRRGFIWPKPRSPALSAR